MANLSNIGTHLSASVRLRWATGNVKRTRYNENRPVREVPTRRLSQPMNTRASEPVILLVDDDEETYNLYSDFLASSGLAVVGANDGEEAIRVAQREQPSLVIMDLGLPLLDGCEATR